MPSHRSDFHRKGFTLAERREKRDTLYSIQRMEDMK
jgi:hypothetical protein